MDPAIVTLLIKMAAAASVVVAASLVTERVGPFLGSMVATLPASAGPIYVILAIDHGADFISQSAIVGLATNVPTAAFTVAHAVAAQRLGTLPSLTIATVIWLIGGALVLQRPWTLAEGLAINAVAYGLAIWFTRRYAKAPLTGRPARYWYDVPVRAAGVATLAGTVSVLGWHVGPSATGVLAAFPAVFFSLVLILQPRIGGPATAAMFVNGLKGLVGFAGALSTVHLMAPVYGAAPALLAALAVSVSWNIGLILVGRRTSAATKP
jgi:uncharacterized membrane protein (GlpM family)